MNSQPNNNQRFATNNTLQNMFNTNGAMRYSNEMVIARHNTLRPKNTIASYESRQQEWIAWCKKMDFEDGDTVSDQKLCFFLDKYLTKERGKKKKKNLDGSPISLGLESYKSYIKAISNLYGVQKTLGINSNDPARGSLVRKFMDNLEKEKVVAKRTKFDDRGKNTLNDGYTKEELQKVSKYFLTTKNSIIGCRDRLCFLISYSMLCRSQTTLGMQFADLFSLVLENLGTTECVALVSTISYGKTNQHGKIEYGSAIRHRDVELCSVGALVIHFFSRFHFENEPFPGFTCRENWYDTAVFKGDESRFKPITYKAQYNAYEEAFDAVGVHTSKVTHANRKSALNMIAQDNVSGDQQRRVGRWGTDRMVGCYISSLPVEAMKSLAGFPNYQGNYFLSFPFSNNTIRRTADVGISQY